MERVQRPMSVKTMSTRTAGEKKITLRAFQCLQRDHPRSKDELLVMYSDYTGASKASAYRILREVKVYGEVQPPKVKTGRKKIEIDEDAKCAIKPVELFFFMKKCIYK